MTYLNFVIKTKSKNQTIVGQLIWLSGLGRFDIAVHIMTMSRFRQQPRIKHLERLTKFIGYLANLPHGYLRFRLHKPDYSNLPHREYDWQRTVYAGAKEEISHDIPEPKGKHVTRPTYIMIKSLVELLQHACTL